MRIAIVGSGPGGMTAMKKMMDCGFDICLFEKVPTFHARRFYALQCR